MVGSAVAIRTVSRAAKNRVVLSARKAKCFLTGGLNLGLSIFSEKLSESVLVGRSEEFREDEGEEVVFPMFCVGSDIVALAMMNCCFTTLVTDFPTYDNKLKPPALLILFFGQTLVMSLSGNDKWLSSVGWSTLECMCCFPYWAA